MEFLEDLFDGFDRKRRQSGGHDRYPDDKYRGHQDEHDPRLDYHEQGTV